MNSFFKSAAIACCSILAASCGTPSVSESTMVFDMGDDGSKFYRIPALITAVDGSLIAAADKRWDTLSDLPARIDVVCKRSEDNGRTWSEAITIAEGKDAASGYGDPALILDEQTGDILCIFAHGCGFWQSTRENPMDIAISRSSDNGKTWSEPENFTSQIYGPECADSVRRNGWYGIFAASGRGLQLRDGRLMFVVAARTTPEWYGPISNYACYSDDGGKTWTVSENAGDYYGDESKVVELNNGDILMSVRNRNKGYRKFSVSKDRGKTWGESYLNKDVLEPACDGDIIRYSSSLDNKRGGWVENSLIKWKSPKIAGKPDILLHSVPYDMEKRQNVSVLYSLDEGQTWKLGKTLTPGYSAYSALTVLPDGTVGALVEEGKWDAGMEGQDGFGLKFFRFSLDDEFFAEK